MLAAAEIRTVLANVPLGEILRTFSYLMLNLLDDRAILIIVVDFLRAQVRQYRLTGEVLISGFISRD